MKLPVLMIPKRLSTARSVMAVFCRRASSATSSRGQRVIFQGPSATPLLETQYAELPQIEPGEILGKVKAATICGSDLHTMLGRRPQEPFPRYI